MKRPRANASPSCWTPWNWGHRQEAAFGIQRRHAQARGFCRRCDSWSRSAVSRRAVREHRSGRRGSIKQWLHKITAQGRTVFLTTHVLETVERLCSQVAIITQARQTGMAGRYQRAGPRWHDLARRPGIPHAGAVVPASDRRALRRVGLAVGQASWPVHSTFYIISAVVGQALCLRGPRRPALRRAKLALASA